MSRSALVPVASPAMCFTSGSGASSRSIFNDPLAVIRLNLEPCWPTYCLSSAASGPALLSRFTSPSTGIRPQVWQLAAILLSVCVAHDTFCLPGSLTLLCRCGAARWRSPLLAKSVCTNVRDESIGVLHKCPHFDIKKSRREKRRDTGQPPARESTVENDWIDRLGRKPDGRKMEPGT